jgi:hypothetical protein
MRDSNLWSTPAGGTDSSGGWGAGIRPPDC